MLRISRICNRERIETRFETCDVNGIYPFAFWPKFGDRNPQFERTIGRHIYHGISLHAELGVVAGAAAPALRSRSSSAFRDKRSCNKFAQDVQVVRAYSRSGCFGG